MDHVQLLKGAEGLKDPKLSPVAEGRFEKILSTDLFRLDDGSRIRDQATQAVKQSTLTEELASDWLAIAISALHTFCQSNLTGPSVKFDPNAVVTPNIEWNKNLTDACIEQLGVDGEEAFGLMSYPYLLLLAEAILDVLVADAPSNIRAFAKWWSIRALVIHQSTLTDISVTLQKRVFDLFKDEEIKQLSESDESVKVLYLVELARARLVYEDEDGAIDPLHKAQEHSGFHYVLTGLLGKRTKYQEKETSQLIVLAKSQMEDENSQSSGSQDEPAALELNSDLLLEQPAYSAAGVKEQSKIPVELQSLDPNNQPALKDVDSAILMLTIDRVRKSSPYRDTLVQEQLLAITNRVITLSPKSSVNWSVFSRALWNRSLLEADSAKTVERGTLQMQSLVEELGQANVASFIPKPTGDEKDESEDITKRLKCIHQLLPLPKWAMDSALAEKYMSLGVLKSALQVYERLEMWGEMAMCLAAVGQEEEGVEIMENHLKTHPRDARGWSILGDITLNPDYWRKAWDIKRYPGAKRALGRFYYNPPKSANVDRDLDEAIAHLSDALKVNPLHKESWFLYGVAGLETAQWELAAQAFTRVVSIDDSDAKAWSNLSSALLRLNKKSEAFSALKRATRAASDTKDWRIWTNYVTVAADLGEWTEAARGIKEIIDIRSAGEKGIDLPILEKLVQELVKGDLPDSGKLDHFQKTVVDLVTVTLPTLITNDPRLWTLHGRVNIWLHRPWAALESFEKGFRVALQNADSTEEAFEQAVDYCTELVDGYVNLGELEGRIEGSVVCKDWKFKARSAIRSVMGKGKNLWDTTPAWDRLMQIKNDL